MIAFSVFLMLKLLYMYIISKKSIKCLTLLKPERSLDPKNRFMFLPIIVAVDLQILRNWISF